MTRPSKATYHPIVTDNFDRSDAGKSDETWPSAGGSWGISSSKKWAQPLTDVEVTATWPIPDPSVLGPGVPMPLGAKDGDRVRWVFLAGRCVKVEVVDNGEGTS